MGRSCWWFTPRWITIRTSASNFFRSLFLIVIQAGTIEQISQLLLLKDTEDYNEKVVRAAASMCERERRTLEAIKLYNIAGAHETVIACLAKALGEVVLQPDGGGDEGRRVEATAREIYYHYSRLNRAAGRARDAVGILLRLREATVARDAGRYEAALEAIEATDLVPFEGDAAKLNRRAAEFESTYDDSVKRNLPIYLPLTMEILAALSKKIKSSSMNGPSQKMVSHRLSLKNPSIAK